MPSMMIYYTKYVCETESWIWTWIYLDFFWHIGINPIEKNAIENGLF